MEMYDRIRQRRIELGMTQDELAIKLGYKSRSTIARIEAGENDINQSKIVAFSKALGVSIEYLLGSESSEVVHQAKKLELTSEEENIIRNYRALDTIHQQRLLGMLQLLVYETTSKD